jgi:hypothetical protein
MRDSVVDGTTGWLLHDPDPPEAGRLVDALARGLEEALDRLADPDVRLRVGRDCREWAEGFDWQRMHAQVLEQVRDALGPVR